MEQLKYGTISHQGLPYNNPFSVEKIEAVIDLPGLNDQAVVLDVGSGRGELLIRLVERYGVKALGLELDASYIHSCPLPCEQVIRALAVGQLSGR